MKNKALSRYVLLVVFSAVLFQSCSKKESVDGGDPSVNGTLVKNDENGNLYLGIDGYYRHIMPGAFSALFDEASISGVWVTVKENPKPTGKMLLNAGLARNSSVASSPIYYVEVMDTGKSTYFYCREVAPAVFKKYHFSEQKIQSHSFTFSDKLEEGSWVKGQPLN